MSSDDDRARHADASSVEDHMHREERRRWDPPYASEADLPSKEDILAAEREQFGGVKLGAAFFGWLTATGMALLLTAALAAAGTAVGLATGTTVDEAASRAGTDPGTVGLVGGIALVAVVFVAYYCGAYVAGRMARFDGPRQGVAVWLWAVVVAAAVAVLGAVAGDRFNVLADLNSFPRIPVGEGDLSTTGLLAAVAVAAASLAGAVLGGAGGMRYHRRVDRAGLGY
jgi:amino acid transporter